MKQVCGTDNVTYNNECLLRKTACERNREITIVKNGTCEGIFSLTKTLQVKCLLQHV